MHATRAAFLLGAACAWASPRLTPGVLPVGDGSVSLKILENAKDVPPPSPSYYTRTVTSGSQTRKERVCSDPELLLFTQELVGMWKDRAGNVMRLARPDRYPWGRDVEYKTERTLANGQRYYIDFEFAEKVSPSEAKSLLRSAASSVTTLRSSASANSSAMQWWEASTADYRFTTDLSRTKGARFVNDSMKELGAMRRCYEFYVPPSEKVGLCRVRVFKNEEGYRAYRSSTGSEDEWSCGLWDPNRQELLVMAEDPEQARRTMRHEGFHQYLSFAVPGRHAVWFNEGHACFMENVRFSGDRKSAVIVEECSRQRAVDRDPARHAAAFGDIVGMSHSDFYSGEINLHYCAAWALTYFLEKGAWTDARYEPYRKVLPRYLELVGSGTDGVEATAAAFAQVEDRSLREDFLSFWNSPKARKKALKTRQGKQ